MQRLDRAGVVAQGDQTPPLLDEGRGPDAGGVGGGAGARELRRRRFRRRGADLLEAVDELADVLLQGRQLADERVDLLEVRDDLALHGLALGAARQRLEPARNRFVLGAEGRQRGVDHQALAFSWTAASSASFSFELSRRAALSTMMVRPFVPTRPLMYPATRPSPIPSAPPIPPPP